MLLDVAQWQFPEHQHGGVQQIQPLEGTGERFSDEVWVFVEIITVFS